MLGIIIATHGTLSQGLKDATEVIMGQTSNLVTLSLNHNQDIQEFGTHIKEAIQQKMQESGVLILTDISSASPYNQAVLAVNEFPKEFQDKVYVVGGVNLPMVLETINHQMLDTPIDQIPSAVLKQGTESVQMWHVSLLTHLEEEDDF